MFYVLFKFKDKSVDYHDGVYIVAMCKFLNIAKKRFFKTYMLRKNVNEIFVKIHFNSITNVWIN